ncbi:hypothetical protein NW768_002919 [Fusarium equiseti]|uniref:Uncharacterized protein n=1 Tax=Fusarium equiseti TaxID=61235 RepID=A0ABQ8RKR7_FUSEQ|nr:hypothetical protein NW768_002919 [Fusarium equiseti]
MANLSIPLAHISVDEYLADGLGNGTQATPTVTTKDPLGTDVCPSLMGKNNSARSLGRAAVSSPVGHVSSPASHEETPIHTPRPLARDLIAHSHPSLPQELQILSRLLSRFGTCAPIHLTPDSTPRPPCCPGGTQVGAVLLHVVILLNMFRVE